VAIKGDKAFPILNLHLNRIYGAVDFGTKRYLTHPDQTIVRTSSKASVRNDLIWDRLVGNFDGVPDTSIKHFQRSNLRYVNLEDKINLWLKKVNSQRVFALNELTEHAQDVLNDAQIELEFSQQPTPDLVVIGYFMNEDETQLKRVSLTPANRKPDWYIDIEPIGNVIEMDAPKQASNGVQLRITRSWEQGEFFA
jgi:hypothetical protein